jgi:phage gp45-like
MKITRDDIIRVVGQYVQPLYDGLFDSITLLTAKVTGIIPFGTVDKVQVSFPFGFVSNPVAGVKALILNLYGKNYSPVVVGQIDTSRPDVQAGEVMLYNQYGQKIYLKNGKILLGSTAAAEPAVLGNQLKTLLLSILDLINTHQHVSSAPGVLTPALDPATIATITNLKASPLNDNGILSSEIFVEKGGA